MNFKLGIFSLFSLFSLAHADINIQNCDSTQEAWVKNAVKEAVYFAGRAADTLQEALNLPVSQNIPSQLQTHLDAFLSQQGERDIYQSILGKS